jgi:hypothetical protein
MSTGKLAQVTLRDERSADGEVSLLEAYVESGGDLVIEGYDAGASVKRAWGDADYEYWRRVKREHVPLVLLHLIKERFASDVDFHKWLREKNIPDEFSSWT